MVNFDDFDVFYVDGRKAVRWDLKFIESHREFNMKNHDFEHIYATFSYNSLLPERTSIEIDEDWIEFRNTIANEFNNLDYPPCSLYVEKDEVSALWFTPLDLLINGIGSEEREVIMKNMELQLQSLSFCKLEKLFASEGDREISEELYLNEYYRKSQFIKVLLSKELAESHVVSKKEEK
jgi:hypothetical protein